MRKWPVRILTAAALLAALTVALILLLAFSVLSEDTKATGDISFYCALSGETQGAKTMILGNEPDFISCPYVIPQLHELEPYVDCRFNYTAKRTVFFCSDAYCLILTYDEEGFMVQKSALETRYTYHAEDSPEGFFGVMPGYADTVDGFALRAVEGGWYPKEMLFIGICDARKEIAIIYYFNQDLDYMDSSLEEFLAEETGWEDVV